MENDRKAIAHSWFDTAEQDCDIALEIAKRWPAAACFHAQQCGEKAIKAITVFYAGDALRSHLISQLLNELQDLEVDIPGDVVKAAQSLGKFYMPTRYPDALGGMSPSNAYEEDDAAGAIKAARTVLAYAKQQIFS